MDAGVPCTAYNDALTRIIAEGRRPRDRDRCGQGDRRRRARTCAAPAVRPPARHPMTHRLSDARSETAHRHDRVEPRCRERVRPVPGYAGRYRHGGRCGSAVWRATEQQYLVLGLRRPVLARARRLRHRPGRLEPRRSACSRRGNTVSPTEFVGLRNYRRHAHRPGVPLRACMTFVAFAAFIVPLTFACSLALALLVNRVRFGQAFFRSVFFLPVACSYVVASLIWQDVDLQRRPLRPGQHGAAGVRRSRAPVAVATRSAAVLGGHRVGAPLAPGRLLHAAVPRRAAADPGGALRGGRGRRRVAGLADVPLHHVPAAAGDVGGGARAVADQRLPGVRRVLQPAVERRAPAPTRRMPARRSCTSITSPSGASRTSGTAAPAP